MNVVEKRDIIIKAMLQKSYPFQMVNVGERILRCAGMTREYRASSEVHEIESFGKDEVWNIFGQTGIIKGFVIDFNDNV